jgi:hypothetical protein
MAIPQIRNKKLKVVLGLDRNPTASPAPSASGTSRHSASNIRRTPAPAPGTEPDTFAKPSISDFTYEDYKAAGLSITEHHDLIGKIREEVPIIDRDEIDGLILSDIAKQLQLCVFSMCKMLHIDPKAVKRMLDAEFWKAYGPDVDDEVIMSIEMEGPSTKLAKGMVEMSIEMEGPSTKLAKGMVEVGVKREESAATAHGDLLEESSAFDEQSRVGSQVMRSIEPPNKKAKKAPLGAVQKEIRAYMAKKKKGRRGCCVLTLRSKAVAEKWAALAPGA